MKQNAVGWLLWRRKLERSPITRYGAITFTFYYKILSKIRPENELEADGKLNQRKRLSGQMSFGK